MTPKETLFFNAIALMHVNKKGGDMLNDMSEVLKNGGELQSVSGLLNMTGAEFLRTNANEVMSTGQAGFGKEFVEEVVLSAELIDRLRESGSILAKATIKQMGGKKVDTAVRGAKLRMVGTTENANAPTGGAVTGENKKGRTASLSLEAKTLIITVYYSDELLEDSIFDIAEFVMGEITDAYETSLHEIIINGDTVTGTTNINWNGANTSTLPDGNKTDFIKFDGGRKLAITKSATENAGANLAVVNIRNARAKMGVKGLNPANLVMVPDTETYFDLMNLSPVETLEKFGDAATIKNGVLTAIDGIEIVNREEMLKAAATGIIDGVTPGNNSKGQILIIHAPSLVVGIRRGLTTETSRYAEEQETGITGSARVAVSWNDVQNNKSATSPVALIINI